MSIPSGTPILPGGSTNAPYFPALSVDFTPAAVGSTATATFATVLDPALQGLDIQFPFVSGATPFKGRITNISGNQATILTLGGGGFGTIGYPFQIVQECINATYTTHASTLTCTLPQTAAASGNTLIGFLSYSGTETLTTPSGWTLVGSHTTSPYSGVAVYKKATASDTGVTFNWGGSDFGSAIVWELFGTRALTINTNADAVSTGGYQVALPAFTPAFGSWPIMLIGAVTSTNGPLTVKPPPWADAYVVDATNSARTAILLAGKTASNGLALPPSYCGFGNATYQTSNTALISLAIS